MSEKATAPLTEAQIVSTITSGMKSTAAADWVQLIADFDTDTVGLAGEELQNADNCIDLMVEDVQGGMTFTAAWAKESPAFIATAKSEASTALTNALVQVVGIFDAGVKALEALLPAL